VRRGVLDAAAGGGVLSVLPAALERHDAATYERPMARAVLLSLTAAAAILGGCAVNPVSGRRELSLVSASRERELGREEAKKIEATMGFVDDPRLAAYVRQVGARLAARAPLAADYTFHVVDMAEPNAFALPGGWVFVSRGLLALMNSEDELAGVLGHEIGHVAARHAVQRVSRAAPIAIVTGLGAAATGLVSPTLGGLVGGMGAITNELLLAPYGRDQEREADRVGAELSAAAGWDPAALASSLRTLEREEGLGRTRTSDGPSFFATHPPLPERVETVTAFAGGLAPQPGARIAATPQAFLERLDGLVVGQSAAEGVFDGPTFVHPDLDVALTFPAGWRTRNARDGVGAIAPQDDAVIVLDVVGTGNDPVRPLAEADARAGTDLARRAERLDVGGRPGAHVTVDALTDDGPIALDITCVAHGDRVFRIVGATRPSNVRRTAAAFRTTARSLRTPTTAERARVRETRLRVVRTRAGETISALVARTRSVWAADMVAVANGLETSARLADGRMVKVAVSEPYARRRERHCGRGGAPGSSKRSGITMPWRIRREKSGS
jgi:predicted Zn-dependent protease